MNARNAVNSILESHDRLEAVVNAAYKRWQKGGDLEGKSKAEFIDALQEPAKMAVVVAQLDAQVKNGGISQWISNGYADVGIDLLKEYCAKYDDLSDLGEILEEITATLEDTPRSSNRGYRRASTGDLESALDALDSVEEDFANALGNRDWDEVDRLLGGSDLDERRFEQACQEVLADAGIETYQVEGDTDLTRLGDELKAGMGDDSGVPKPEVWSWKIVIDRDTVYASPNRFRSEEDADEDGRSTDVDFDEIEGEARDRVEEKAADELVQEYSRHLKDSSEAFEELDSQYYDISDQVLAAFDRIVSNHDEPAEPPRGDGSAATPEAPKASAPADYAPKSGADDWRQESASKVIAALVEGASK